MIKVFGHSSPDTDSVVSPIAYAWFLNEQGKDARAFISGEMNKEAVFVLERFGFEQPDQIGSLSEGDEIVVLDTNNGEELIDGIENTKIIKIIDHHKLFGNLSTEEPIDIVIQPVACTATLILDEIKSSKIEITKEIAGLLLSAILSDTLNFTSPTTTEHDKLAAKALAEIAGEDPDSLADEMFAAKSDLSGMSAEDIVLSDSKVFEFDDETVRISVLETTLPKNAIDMKKELQSAMNTIKEKEDLDMIFFFIVDILNSNSILIVSDEDEVEIADEAFGVEVKDMEADLAGVVSRKKQMVPNLEKVIG